MSKRNIIEDAKQAATYLRKEADFNRSWIDGRRDPGKYALPEYFERRKEYADERDRWADAIEHLVSEVDKTKANFPD